MKDTKRRIATKTVAKIGVLAAISYVLMFFSFPLPFIAPSFYELDFSESIILIGGFAMGPWAAVALELVKNLLNLLIDGTKTGCVGELANFVMGCSFTVTASLIYKRKKNKKAAFISMFAGVIALLAASFLMNYFVMIPVYSKVFFGGNLEAIINMGASVFPIIDSLFELVLLCTVPFNFIKGVLCAVICYLLYKRVSPVLHI